MASKEDSSRTEDSTKMCNYKALHVADSLSDLMSKAKEGMPDIKNCGLDVYARIVENFWNLANKTLLYGDEEIAFLNFKKYIDACIFGMEYKINFDKSHLKEAMSKLEILKSSLIERYSTEKLSYVNKRKPSFNYNSQLEINAKENLVRPISVDGRQTLTKMTNPKWRKPSTTLKVDNHVKPSSNYFQQLKVTPKLSENYNVPAQTNRMTTTKWREPTTSRAKSVSTAASNYFQRLKIAPENTTRKLEIVKKDIDIPGIEGKCWKTNCTDLDDALIGGNNHTGEPIYIARMFMDDQSILPGKLLAHGKCQVSLNGNSISSKTYEILCDKEVGWLQFNSNSKQNFPQNAILGGVDNLSKQLLFIGRIKHDNCFFIGKVEYVTKLCYVLIGGNEFEFDNFQLLVSSKSSKEEWAARKIGTKTKLPANFENNTLENIKKLRSLVQINRIDTQTLKKDFDLIKLNDDDIEFKNISIKLNNSIKSHMRIPLFRRYKIISIEKVWNIKLRKWFDMEVMKIKDKNNGNANIQELFHGSTVCNEIVKNGFEIGYSKIEGMFGAGVYFADISSKSCMYSICSNHTGRGQCTSSCTRQMLICKVALGNIKKLTSSHNYSHAPPGFHSVQGVAGSTLAYNEFIVYKGEQAFPRYLITFQTE